MRACAQTHTRIGVGATSVVRLDPRKAHERTSLCNLARFQGVKVDRSSYILAVEKIVCPKIANIITLVICINMYLHLKKIVTSSKICR